MHAATIYDAGWDDKLMFFFHGPYILLATWRWSRRDNFWTIDFWGLLLLLKMTSVKFPIEWYVSNWYLGDIMTSYLPTPDISLNWAQITRAKVCNF